MSFSAESCDMDGWEGQAGSFQSHSRVWPLSGALHFGRGGDSHTHTHTSHGECFKYQGRECVSCVCEKALEEAGVMKRRLLLCVFQIFTLDVSSPP